MGYPNRVKKAVDRLRLLAGQDTSGNGVPFLVDSDGRLEVVSNRTVHAARVYNNATISHTTSGSYQTLTFNSESLDTDGFHSLTVNTGRLTIVNAGVYLFGGQVFFAFNATGERWARIRLNGTTDLALTRNLGHATINAMLNLSGLYSLSAGDYLTLQAYQNSGGALNMSALAISYPSFWAARL